jgi:galactokinase
MGGSKDAAIAGFIKHFGSEPTGVWSAPGRVNLIGEHTDYNEGFVLPFAINRRTYAAIASRGDGIARVASGFTDEVVEIPVEQISKDSVSGWSGYPLGVAWALIQAGAKPSGFDLYVESDVPVGAGLSSSAAIECSVAMGLNEIWGANLDRSALAKIGQRAENEIVGAPTGIMDQTASLFGSVDHVVFLDCRSLVSEAIPLGLEQNLLEIVVMDTKVAHRLVDGGYAARRAACEEGAGQMGVSSLRDLSIDDLSRAQSILDPLVYKRTRHVITENARVLETVELLKSSGPQAIGELLYASHESMRDDFEISIDELDCAVETAMKVGAVGARMTGGGFGGAAIALIHSSKVAELKAAVSEAFEARGFAKPELFSVLADAGAKRES